MRPMRLCVPVFLLTVSFPLFGQIGVRPKPMPIDPATAAADASKGQDRYALTPPTTKKWVVQGVIATRSLLDCPVPRKRPQSFVAVGGFACARAWKVELLVKTNDPAVYVTPGQLEVETGDCVVWEVRKEPGDSGSVEIGLIQFFNVPSDIPAGKHARVNQTAVNGPYCETGGAACGMLIALPPGTYRYKAVVHHGKINKTSDPELDVSCNCVTAP